MLLLRCVWLVLCAAVQLLRDGVAADVESGKGESLFIFLILLSVRLICSLIGLFIVHFVVI